MLPAARITDMHVCPMVTPGVPPIPHVGGPIVTPGHPMVLIGFLPAATVGSTCVCVGPPDSIVKGSATVMIGGKPAARMGDMTAHGGVIVAGFPTVLIGDGAGGGGGGSAGAGGFGATPPNVPLTPAALLNNLKEAIKSKLTPKAGEPPLLSWERLKGSLGLNSKELGKPGEKGLSLDLKYKVKEGNLFGGKNEPPKEDSTTLLGIPLRGKAETKNHAYEIGGGAGVSKDGVNVGAYGEYASVQREYSGVAGTKNIGLTGDVGAKGPAAEGFIGVKDNQFGAKVGASLVSAEGAIGANVAGVNVGVKGEIGLKAELGFEFGAKGVEVKLPFVSFGITFGAAK